MPIRRAPEQQAEIAGHLGEVDPLLRRGAGLELDGRRPVAGLADVLEDLLSARS